MSNKSTKSYVPDFRNNNFVQGVIQVFENADNPSELPSGGLKQLQAEYSKSVALLLSHEIEETKKGSVELALLMDAVHISALLLSRIGQVAYIRSLIGPDISQDGTKPYNTRVVRHLANHAIQSVLSNGSSQERKTRTIHIQRYPNGKRRGW